MFILSELIILISLERYKVAHAKQLEGNAEPAAGPSSGAKINIAPQESGEQPKKSCC
jgi:hypothetical protein